MYDVLVDEFRQPFTADETRVMCFTGGQYRLRIDKGKAPARLTVTIEEAPPDKLIFRDWAGALREVEVSDARGGERIVRQLLGELSPHTLRGELFEIGSKSVLRR